MFSKILLVAVAAAVSLQHEGHLAEVSNTRSWIGIVNSDYEAGELVSPKGKPKPNEEEE